MAGLDAIVQQNDNDYKMTVRLLELMSQNTLDRICKPSDLLRHYANVFNKEARALEEEESVFNKLSVFKILDINGKEPLDMGRKVQDYVASVVGTENLGTGLTFLLTADKCAAAFSFASGTKKDVTEMSEEWRARPMSNGIRGDYLIFGTELLVYQERRTVIVDDQSS